MRVVLIALAILASSAPSGAQCPQTELLGSDTAPGHRFGEHVVLDGDDLWVSAPGWTNPGSGLVTGRVYRMSHDGVTLGSFIGPEAGADFGGALAVDGGTVVIGSSTADAPIFNSGRVWIRTWDGVSWQNQTLVPQPPVQNGRFGRSVAIEGDVLAVGAPGDPSPFATGAVHVFRRTAGVWALEQLLDEPGTPAAGSDFGRAVALSQGRLFVSAPKESLAPTGTVGRVHVYAHDGAGWTTTGTIDSPIIDSQSDAFTFGESLDADGDRLAVGAPRIESPLVTSGFVMVWRETAPGSWTQEAMLTVPDSSRLGTSVALRGDRLLAGAPFVGYEDVLVLNAEQGAVFAFAFDGSTWTQTHRLRARLIVDQSRFGWSVDMDDDVWIAGGSQGSPAGPVSGVQHFDADLVDFADPWVEQGAGLGGGPEPPVIDAHGALCQGAVVRAWTRLDAASASAYLVLGFSQVDLPFKGGVLVPFPDLVLGPLVADSGPLGDFLEVLLPLGAQVPPSVTVSMQFWVPDPGGPAGFLASPGATAVSPP